MALFIVVHCGLDTCGNEEILLLQTKLLARIVIIIRVKHLYNILCQVLLLHRLLIISLIKGIQMELIDRLRIPDTKGVHHIVAIAYHRHIVRYCQHRLIALLNKIISLLLLVIFHTDITAEFYFRRIFRTADLKRIAVLQPVIRNLLLITVLNLLLEHPVTVPDAAAVSRISKGRKRIQEACRQSSKAAVSESCIPLLILDHIQITVQLLQRFLHFIIKSQVDQIISQRTSHQEFHGKIINGLGIRFFHFLRGRHPCVNDGILHRITDCLENLLLCGFLHCLAVQGLHIIDHASLKQFLVKISLFCHNAPPSVFLPPGSPLPGAIVSPNISCFS